MIRFDNWTIQADGDILARQFDNLTRTLTVAGDIPTGWEWAVLVQVGNAMDILPLTATEGALNAVLTAQQLSVGDKYYNMQLRGTQGELVKHTNTVNVYIPASLSGDEQWPTVPSEFTEMERRVVESTNKAQAAATAAGDSAGKAETAAGDADTAKKTAQEAAASAGQSATGAAASEQAAEAHKKGAEAATVLAEGYTSHPPIIGENSNWWEWNGETYVDTAKPSRGEQGVQGETGKGVVKYSFDPEIWRWVMKYTDGHINTYPGFSPHDRNKFVVWRDTFEPGRENVNFGTGPDTLYASANARAYYTIPTTFHSNPGMQYGIEYVDGSYVAKLVSCGTGRYDYNRMVTKCCSWGAYIAQFDFKLKAPLSSSYRPGLVLNLFEGWKFHQGTGEGTIQAYISATKDIAIRDNTSGTTINHYLYDDSGNKPALDYETWYTVKMTCAPGAMTLSLWPRDKSEAAGWKVECQSSSITDEAIEAQKALRIQTYKCASEDFACTVYVDNLLMWEDFLPDKNELVQAVLAALPAAEGVAY